MSPSTLSRKVASASSDYTPSAAGERKGLDTIFQAMPEPDNELRRYRLLAPKAGLRVSPLCIGAMSIGDQWKGFMGNSLDQAGADKFLDTYYGMGGNFIDTANNYQDEQSELIIGEWMEKRGIRDEIVLATKFTTPHVDRKEGKFAGIQVNFAGNHKKSLKHSLDASLKKLRTDYIDILYVHWWDYTTPVEEVMHSLNDMVREGKVLYLGISDTPAWIVSQANEYAKAHGLAQFVLYQGAWNLSSRDLERDVLPMCRANGMGIAPWNVMGGGLFKTPKELEERGDTTRGGNKPSEEQQAVCKALEEVANEIGQGTHLAHVAMAWCRQMYPYCFPIIGGTNIEHLKSNIESLKITLSEAQLDKLTKASPFNPGFPRAFFGNDGHTLPGGKSDSPLLNSAGHIQFVKQ